MSWLLSTDILDADCTPYHVLYRDPTSHPLVVTVFAVYYLLVFIFGLLGNLAIIIVTLRHKSLQTVQNIFILNLAASGVILCVLSIPLTPITHIYKQWYFGNILCRVVGGTQAVGMFIGSFSLCAIAIDRYFRLVVIPGKSIKPVAYCDKSPSMGTYNGFLGKPLRRHHAIRITWALWSLAFLVAVPYVAHMRMRTYEHLDICGEFCTEKWPDGSSKYMYTLFVFVIQAVIPFTAMTLCYRSLFAFLRKRAFTRMTSIGQQVNMLYLLAATAGGESQQYTEQLSHLIEQKRRLVRQKRRVTVILLSMVIIFGVTSLPHNVVSIITEFDSEYELTTTADGTDLSYMLHLLSHSMAMMSCATNPVLYAFLNPEFRDVIMGSISRQHRINSRARFTTQCTAV